VSVFVFLSLSLSLYPLRARAAHNGKPSQGSHHHRRRLDKALLLLVFSALRFAFRCSRPSTSSVVTTMAKPLSKPRVASPSATTGSSSYTGSSSASGSRSRSPSSTSSGTDTSRSRSPPAKLRYLLACVRAILLLIPFYSLFSIVRSLMKCCTGSDTDGSCPALTALVLDCTQEEQKTAENGCTCTRGTGRFCHERESLGLLVVRRRRLLFSWSGKKRGQVVVVGTVFFSCERREL